MALSPSKYKVAVFSPEWGVTPIGGLGILVDDMLKSAADLRKPYVGVSIYWHHGSFRQIIDKNGWQHEEDVYFRPEEIGLELLRERIKTKISRREVTIGAYQHEARPNVLHLTTNLAENSEWDRGLTARPYDDGNGNKHYYRTAQYRILAAGVRFLQKLDYDIELYHLNEGHTALVALELLNQGKTPEEIREKVWFTTHTPLEAALDHFDAGQVGCALPDEFNTLKPFFVYFDNKPYFGAAEFAIRFSRGVNAVSKKHAEVCSRMSIFDGVDVIPITNGIHLPTWVHPAKAELYKSEFGEDAFMDPSKFLKSELLDYQAFRRAHRQAQNDLFDLIQQETGVRFQEGYLTIGFARRAVPYKRADLLMHDVEALARIMKDKAQIVFAGKAHPADIDGKKMIQRVWQRCSELRRYGVNAVYLPNYGRDVARVLVGGVDAWLNNPEIGREASGTSGMKVAANGGINISNKDGWNYEALNENNGFIIDSENQGYEGVAHAIMHLLEHQVIPQFGTNEWEERVKESLKLAAHFNTNRVVEEYAKKAYGLEERVSDSPQESRLVA